MSGGLRFSAPGSPLHGKNVPLDWGRMTPDAKRRALVAYGYATSYKHACSKMGVHAAAVVRQRREWKEAEEQRLQARRHPEGKD